MNRSGQKLELSGYGQDQNDFCSMDSLAFDKSLLYGVFKKRDLQPGVSKSLLLVRFPTSQTFETTLKLPVDLPDNKRLINDIVSVKASNL